MTKTPMFIWLVLLAACNPHYDTPEGVGQGPGHSAQETGDMALGAEFPGGQQKMMNYIRRNLRYPETARQDELEGKVYVEFVVGKTGRVGKIKIKRGVRADLDRECIRVISGMPEWIPAMNNGKPVEQRFVLPVNFKLE